MPSSLHQGVARLLSDDPRIAYELLLRRVFAVDLPDLVAVETRPGVLDRFAPCFGDTRELRPDGVLLAKYADIHGDIGLIIEVQKKVDPVKRFRLWVYWALVAEELAAETYILLISLSDAVSRWAQSICRTNHGLLLVLDRQNMPVVTDPEIGRHHPAWITLSAVIHGSAGNLAPLSVALPIILELPDERRWRYASYILAAIPERERNIIMGALKMQRYELSDIERRSIAFHDGLEEGREEGRRGTLVEMVLALLEVRAVPLAASDRQRITAATLEQLERWRELARSVGHAEALFES
ncbi:MAG: hypothetical protein KC431_24220 [Myxococcales bacterium]|nr:hypothetical protein [Myxococcales bacterium]